MSNYGQLGMTSGIHDLSAQRELAFTEEEYRERHQRLRSLMRRDGIDLLFLTTPEAIAWLHGFYCGWYAANGPTRYPQTYGTVVHAHSDKMIHFDNPTERPLLLKMSVCNDNRYFSSRDGETNLHFVMNELEREGLLTGTVGMEFWSYIPNRAISSMIETAFRERGCGVVDASIVTREARRVKSKAELDVVREAMRICDIGHEAILEYARVGKTELEVMGDVNREMMKAGGELPALIHIFNTRRLVDGRVASSGHSMPTTKKLTPGVVLVADLCGVKHRYHANVMRGYFIGEPPAKVVETYELAAGAFDMAQERFKAGMTVGEVNNAFKQYCEKSGLAKEDGWILGYELGLSLPPDWVGEFFFNMLDTEYLDRQFLPGMVTNLEVLFGTALIDTLIWSENGTENLTTIPRKLLTLPV